MVSSIPINYKVSTCGVMANKLDYEIRVSEFKCYCIHFQTNTLEKGMNPPPYYSTKKLDNITTILL